MDGQEPASIGILCALWGGAGIGPGFEVEFDYWFFSKFLIE